MTDEHKPTPEEVQELWYQNLRKTFSKPIVEYNDVRYRAIQLEHTSKCNGWSQHDVGNALILVHEFGHTITINCSDYDNGCIVIATASDEAPSDVRPSVGTGVITNNRIASAYNVAISKVFQNIRKEYTHEEKDYENKPETIAGHEREAESLG